MPVLGERSFVLEGEVHQLVTFLNKTLKDRDLIFGLTLRDGAYFITVYDSSARVNSTPSTEAD